MAAVLEIEGLHKTYRGLRGGARVALDGLDMSVQAGQVHGFLGPNGSGKTTTLRTLLGLVRPGAGRMYLFGHPVPAALPLVAPRIGAIVESPQFFGNFTGRRTLRLLATAGSVPHTRVDEVLEMVGMRDRAADRVRTYSLGMKQRLAVASALLKSPELLILDEPANGLDPAGIRAIRDLLRSLPAAGTTVVLSSHILAEVQHICDSVTIVSRGRRVGAGPVADVLAAQDRGEYRVRVAEPERAAQILARSGLPVTVHDDHLVVGDLADSSWITETLAAHQLFVAELSPINPDLESVFLRLTGTTPAPATGATVQIDQAYQPPVPDHDPRMVVLSDAATRDAATRDSATRDGGEGVR
ncbi:MAG TPA: ABC transporter ATP-binding protein [Micromonosporaceae bacterium]|nr:ABC transporter ATP-binding protein [Micromonosporaceae bacterium]